MNYAHWRKQDGSAAKHDDSTYAPTALLERFGSIAKVTGTGISWPGFGFRKVGAAIYSSVVIVDSQGKQLNEADSINLVDKSVNELIRESGGGKPIPPSDLLKRVNKKAGDFFRKGVPTKRTLVTSLSIEKGCLPVPITVEGYVIASAERKDFPYPEPLEKYPSYVSKHLKDSKYLTIKIEILQATHHQAFDAGITIVDFLRGVWNHLITFQSHSISFSNVPKRRFIGRIHIAPIHTLHEEDKTKNLAYWYEPDYVEDVENYRPDKQWELVEKNREWVCKQVAESPLRDELIQLFGRYARALDQANLGVCHLMLWGILEKLTNSIGGNYDEAIKRAASHYRDRKLSKELLHQMRWRRNQFVHAAASPDEREELCWTTKAFVDGLLDDILHNDFKVKNLKEFGECLALPHNKERLAQLRDWHAKAHDIEENEEKELAEDEEVEGITANVEMPDEKKRLPEAQNIDASDGSDWQVRIGPEVVKGENKYRVQFSLKTKDQPDGQDKSCCLIERTLLDKGVTLSHYDGVGVGGKHRDLYLDGINTDVTTVRHHYVKSGSPEWGKGNVPVKTKELTAIVQQYVDWIRDEPLKA